MENLDIDREQEAYEYQNGFNQVNNNNELDITNLINRYIDSLKKENNTTIPTQGVIHILEYILEDVVFKSKWNKRNTELECLVKYIKAYGIR